MSPDKISGYRSLTIKFFVSKDKLKHICEAEICLASMFHARTSRHNLRRLSSFRLGSFRDMSARGMNMLDPSATTEDSAAESIHVKLRAAVEILATMGMLHQDERNAKIAGMLNQEDMDDNEGSTRSIRQAQDPPGRARTALQHLIHIGIDDEETLLKGGAKVISRGVHYHHFHYSQRLPMSPDYSSPFQHPLSVSPDVSQCLTSTPIDSNSPSLLPNQTPKASA